MAPSLRGSPDEATAPNECGGRGTARGCLVQRCRPCRSNPCGRERRAWRGVGCWRRPQVKVLMTSGRASYNSTVGSRTNLAASSLVALRQVLNSPTSIGRLSCPLHALRRRHHHMHGAVVPGRLQFVRRQQHLQRRAGSTLFSPPERGPAATSAPIGTVPHRQPNAVPYRVEDKAACGLFAPTALREGLFSV